MYWRSAKKKYKKMLHFEILTWKSMAKSQNVQYLENCRADHRAKRTKFGTCGPMY